MRNYFIIIIIYSTKQNKKKTPIYTAVKKKYSIADPEKRSNIFFFSSKIDIHTHTDFLIFMFLYFVIYLLFYLSSHFTCYYFKINVFLLLSSLFIGKQISNFID